MRNGIVHFLPEQKRTKTARIQSIQINESCPRRLSRPRHLMCLALPFKTHLDKFWMHQDMYDFAADLTGIGDRSVREIS